MAIISSQNFPSDSRGCRPRADGVTYHLIDLRLNGHESQATHIRKLRDEQELDFQGHDNG